VSKQTKPLVINHMSSNIFYLFGVMVPWHNEGLKKQQFQSFKATFNNSRWRNCYPKLPKVLGIS